MNLLYNVATKLFLIIAPIYLKLRLFKKKEHPERYKEKLSLIKVAREPGCLIWFHAASVGETMSILPLVKLFSQETKISKILITTITLSSAEIVKKKMSGNNKVIHQFLPFDNKSLIKKFLNHWAPSIGIFVDSEIWPNFINEIKFRNIPLVLINGRMTEKSFNNWIKVKNFAEKIFRKFDLCIVSNNKTKEYLEKLGSSNIKYYGNLKFANINEKQNKIYDEEVERNFYDNKIWCASSTHKTEEIFCAKVHVILKKKFKNLVTIIIPRHINRNNEIIKSLNKLNLNVSVINSGQKIQIEKNSDIFLINSYGETNKYFKVAKSVFLGGSMINHGGQNPIEAARNGCRIYHGPNIDNFSDVYAHLKNLDISKQVENDEQLTNYLAGDFLKNESKNKKEIAENINNYGNEILNNVFNEIKNYIRYQP